MRQLDFDRRWFRFRGCLLARHGLVVPLLETVPAASSRRPLSPIVPLLSGKLYRRTYGSMLASQGLVTLGRIISSPQSLAYWNGPDNINQLVKLLARSQTMKVSGETRSRIRREARRLSASQVRIEWLAMVFSRPGRRAKVTHSESTALRKTRADLRICGLLRIAHSSRREAQ